MALFAFVTGFHPDYSNNDDNSVTLTIDVLLIDTAGDRHQIGVPLTISSLDTTATIQSKMADAVKQSALPLGLTLAGVTLFIFSPSSITTIAVI